MMVISEEFDSHFEVEWKSVPLLRYVSHSMEAPLESPRPYLHPLRTLGGRVVSGFRPHDHRWHHGLSLTSAFASGHNFWGGPTYTDGAYRQLNNNGIQQTQEAFVHHDSAISAKIGHRLDWLTASGEILAHEVRTLGCRVASDESFWELKWSSEITLPNGSEPLRWGSPTTQGRENAGYGGLFWRGPRDFIGGKILMSEGREGPDLMGELSPWLAYIGRHDETDDVSTLVFIDEPGNPNSPSPWFVRNTTPMVCPNFAFGSEYVQQPGEVLRIGYNIIIADGEWSRERIEDRVGKITKHTKPM